MVANCHKMPQKLFSKELISVEMISNSVQSTIDLINSINKNVKFIFTISPVRHIKDGFFENNVSKGHLFSATNLIVNASNAKENISYFPSFEIMMDELRDYRFYADDLLHPSPLAIDYIWDYFKKSLISKAIFEIMDEVEHIQKALLHKPFNPSSENHQKFLEVLQSKIAKLQEQFLNFQF